MIESPAPSQNYVNFSFTPKDLQAKAVVVTQKNGPNKYIFQDLQQFLLFLFVSHILQ